MAAAITQAQLEPPEPAELFAAFATGSYNSSSEALQRLADISDKTRYLPHALRLLADEPDDTVRCWGASAVAVIGGKKAFDALLAVFTAPSSVASRPAKPAFDHATGSADDEKRLYRYTRFFALRGLKATAASQQQQARLRTLLEELWVDPWQDATEDYLVQAEAAVLLALDGHQDALAQVRAMFRNARADFWIVWAVCRALQEFPNWDVQDELAELAGRGFYLEHRARAIRALGSYEGDESVVSHLSVAARKSPDPYLRLTAVRALGSIGNAAGKSALLNALFDEDAEIRVQASHALAKLLTAQDAVREIIQRALSDETPRDVWEHLYDALRRIDVERLISVEILNKELGGEDRRRAEAAEEILLNLGGWAAMHRLSQRRSTLQTLDDILSESEQVVRSTFRQTVRQAHLNFYFAMAVNVLVVAIGVALIVIAIVQLTQTPGKLETWILPGGGGVLGIVINGWFNNPRVHAREDLRTLMNVNVIFLGFLRQLNQIDATFKHAYIEGFDFGADDMEVTVRQIDRTVHRTLEMALVHLNSPGQIAAEANEETTPEAEPAPEAAPALLAPG